MTELSLSVDVRKEVKKNFTVHVQYKNVFWVKVGMWIIKIGCWIGGFTLVDEFPMSLLDEYGKEIER